MKQWEKDAIDDILSLMERVWRERRKDGYSDEEVWAALRTIGDIKLQLRGITYVYTEE